MQAGPEAAWLIATGPRPLFVQVWYPAADSAVEGLAYRSDVGPWFMAGRSAENGPPVSPAAKHPLILLSHGTGGSSAMLAWLAEALARNGYVVAAVNHHGNTSTESAPTAEGFMLWWERFTAESLATVIAMNRRSVNTTDFGTQSLEGRHTRWQAVDEERVMPDASKD